MSKKEIKKAAEEVMTKFSKTFEKLAEVETPSYTEQAQDLFYNEEGKLQLVKMEYDPLTQAIRITSIEDIQYGTTTDRNIEQVAHSIAKKLLDKRRENKRK